MYRIWLLVDPRRALIGLVAWLGFLALLLHFIMLSTDRFNWIEGPRASRVKTSEGVAPPAPPAAPFAIL